MLCKLSQSNSVNGPKAWNHFKSDTVSFSPTMPLVLSSITKLTLFS
jgi:hypothetical protein